MPERSQDGSILMLCYFDDSGTHDGSKIVVLAGLIGDQKQYDHFSDLWSKKLKAPSPTKEPLKRFHMTECQASDGEFGGWSRTATDYLVRELGDIILESGLIMFGKATLRKDWDDLITGVYREALGNAEGDCARCACVGALEFAQHFAPNPQLAFVFDDRPQSNKENNLIFKAFDPGHYPNMTLTFANSRNVLPLQGADLIAWEFYQHALAYYEGKIEITGFFRPQFERLAKSGRMRLKIARREEIQKILKAHHPKMIENMAHYFKTGEKAEITEADFIDMMKNPLIRELYLKRDPSAREFLEKLIS